MSTQITLPSAGGGTPLEGPKYKYIYGNKTGNENGAELLDAISSFQLAGNATDKTILLAPGDYYLSGNKIDLTGSGINIKGWTADSNTASSFNRYANIFAYAEEEYQFDINVSTDFSTYNDLFIPGYFSSNVVSAVELSNGDKIYLGWFYGATSARLIKIDTNGIVTPFSDSNIDVTKNLLYFNDGVNPERIAIVTYSSIKIINCDTFTTIHSIAHSGVINIYCNFGYPSDNSIYVTGYFTSLGGVLSRKIAKINFATGIVDSTFGSNIGTSTGSSNVGSLSVTDDFIVISGSFSSFNGTPVSNIYALDRNGLNTGAAAIFNTAIGTGTLDPTFNTKIGSTILLFSSNGITLNGNAQGQFVGLDFSGNITFSHTAPNPILNSFLINSDDTRFFFIVDEKTHQNQNFVGNLWSIDEFGTMDGEVLINSGLPVSISVGGFLTKTLNSSNYFFSYSLIRSEDPSIFTDIAQTSFIENIFCSQVVMSTGANSIFNNCQFIRFGNVGGSSGSLEVELNNSRVEELLNNVSNLKNSYIQTAIIYNTPSYYNVYFGTIIENCEIENLYSGTINMLGGDFTIVNSNISNAFSVSRISSFYLTILNSRFRNLLDQSEFINSVRFKIQDVFIEDTGLCFVTSNAFANSVSIDISLINVSSVNALLSPAISTENVFSNINLKNCSAGTYFLLFKYSNLLSDTGIISAENCSGGIRSFNIEIFPLVGEPEFYFPTLSYINCNSGENSFNVSITGIGGDAINQTAKFINCNAFESSFNATNLGVIMDISACYKNCCLFSKNGSGFQVYLTNPTDYMIDCTMREVNSGVNFQNSIGAGFLGKLINCVKIDTAGVVTINNYY